MITKITHNTVTGKPRETDFYIYRKLENRVALADSYKYSHASQYPEMESMFDYMSSRGGIYPKTIVAGGQTITKGYFDTPIEQWEVDEAYADAQAHGVPFDIEGWDYIVQTLNGNLPVRIKTIAEGKLVPVNMVMMTFESTDEKVGWVAGWMETIYMTVWYPTTIATKSYYVKQMLSKLILQQHTHSFNVDPLLKTQDDKPVYEKFDVNDKTDYFSQLDENQRMTVLFMYHNFGARGSTVPNAAQVGGFAHSTQFYGTDNFASLRFVRNLYNQKSVASWSVFATEHSTTTANANGSQKLEEAFVYRMLGENPDSPIMSFVADSYDTEVFTDFCTGINTRIRKLVDSRPNFKFVLRPDSGNPLVIVKMMLKKMVKNKVKMSKIGELIKFDNYAILWGDGITPFNIEEISMMVIAEGFAIENMVFGSGGDLMQNLNRDTQRFAIKCSSITKPDGTEQDVFKNPITDPSKASKKGRITTYMRPDGSCFVGRIGQPLEECVFDLLETVFENGNIIKEYNFEDIRVNS